MIDHQDQTRACLLGILIGDALGQPVETLKPEEILQETGGQGVSTFMAPLQTRVGDTRNLKAGDYTDDWQLTHTVAESLIASRGYDQRDMALRHVAAYRAGTIGWGQTTTRAVKELARYFETDGAEGRSPLTPVGPQKPGQGAGNGVAMKVAPLGIFNVLKHGEPNPGELLDRLRQLAQLTHPDPRALYTAYALALLIANVMHQPIRTKEQAHQLLTEVTEQVARAESQVGLDPASGSVSRPLQTVESLVGDPEQIRVIITPGFLATESVVYAIGIFLTYLPKFGPN